MGTSRAIAQLTLLCLDTQPSWQRTHAVNLDCFVSAALSRRTGELEVQANYSDAKAAHEARVALVNNDISERKDTIKHLADSLR